MQLKLSDISPGDIIEHESWGCNHGGMQERLTRRKGKVIQVTDKVITLQGKNYPETLLVNDLLSGRAKILKVKMRGEEDMVKYDWDTLWPQVQELQAQGKPLVTIADEININIHALKSKLYRERQEEKQTLPPESETTKLVCETCVSHHVDDGVCWCIDNKTEHSGSCGSCSKYPSGCIHWEKQTQPPELDQAANQEPDEGEGESATEIIPQKDTVYTVERIESLGKETAVTPNTPYPEKSFTVEDEEPIPYTVAPDHHNVAEEIACLLDRKGQDYGTENIKKFGSHGVLVRVSDKVERLINLSRKEGQVNFESVEDSWKDIAGYAILALIELREGR